MAGQSQTLYRKWRSQTFSDLVGQDAVIHTLRQAVAHHRLTHAYLFCGPRGTGKTSTARLLAKMVNCQSPRDGEPCNACLPCVEITEGRSTDVFEIDAASNRGIDEIRDLRERVRISSVPGHYKVYIIDEVHMLTTEAFNALLKTLEEPPPHVIFVLATTEAHKVPATVVSRCQHFDFRRIALRDIISRLSYICEQEAMQADPLALELIARSAQGGMRDALSLLDQARAFAGDIIRSDAVRDMLGMADPALVRELITFVAASDTAAGLHRINDLAQSGIDVRQLASQIAEIWRQLMLARAGADIALLLDISPEEAADLKTLSMRFSLETLTECARIFARNDAGARIQVVPQLALELAFLDCVAAMQGKATPRATATITPMPIHAPPTPQPALHIVPPAAPAPMTPIAAAVTPSAPVTNGHQPTAIAEIAAVPTGAAPVATSIREAGAAKGYGQGQDLAAIFANVASQWDLIRKVCKQQSASTAALLAAALPVAAEPSDPVTIVIAVEHNFHLEKLSTPANREKVEEAIKQIIDVPCHARFVPQSEAGNYAAFVQPDVATSPGVPLPPSTSQAAPASSSFVSATPSLPPPPVAAGVPQSFASASASDPRAMAMRDPLVQALQREFGAKISEVRSPS